MLALKKNLSLSLILSLSSNLVRTMSGQSSLPMRYGQGTKFGFGAPGAFERSRRGSEFGSNGSTISLKTGLEDMERLMKIRSKTIGFYVCDATVVQATTFNQEVQSITGYLGTRKDVYTAPAPLR